MDAHVLYDSTPPLLLSTEPVHNAVGVCSSVWFAKPSQTTGPLTEKKGVGGTDCKDLLLEVWRRSEWFWGKRWWRETQRNLPSLVWQILCWAYLPPSSLAHAHRRTDMRMSFQTFFPMQQTLYQYSFFNVFNLLHVSSKVSVVSDLNWSQQDQRLVTCHALCFRTFAVPCAPASLHGLSSGSWRVVPASAIEDIAAQNLVQLKPIQPIHHMWRISCIHNSYNIS